MANFYIHLGGVFLRNEAKKINIEEIFQGFFIYSIAIFGSTNYEFGVLFKNYFNMTWKQLHSTENIFLKNIELNFFWQIFVQNKSCSIPAIKEFQFWHLHSFCTHQLAFLKIDEEVVVTIDGLCTKPRIHVKPCRRNFSTTIRWLRSKHYFNIRYACVYLFQNKVQTTLPFCLLLHTCVWIQSQI